MAHVSAADTTILKLWKHSARRGGEMANPADLGFVQNDNGRWIKPLSDEELTQLKLSVKG